MKLPDNTAKTPDANGAHHLLSDPGFQFRKNSSSEPAGSNGHSEASRGSASTRTPLTVILGAMPSTQISGARGHLRIRDPFHLPDQLFDRWYPLLLPV